MRPPLLPGAAFPIVTLTDLAGQPLGSPKRPTLVVSASVKHPLSRRLIEQVVAHLATHPDRRALWVLADAPAAIAAYRSAGGQLPGVVVADTTRALRDALRVSVLPTLHVFDGQAKLTAYRRAPWPAAQEWPGYLSALPLDVVAAASSPSPAPSPSAAPADEPSPSPSPKPEEPPQPKTRRGRRGRAEPARPAKPSPAKPSPAKPSKVKQVKPKPKPAAEESEASTSPSPESSPSPEPAASPSVAALSAAAPSAAALVPTTGSLPEVDGAALLAAWRKLVVADHAADRAAADRALADRGASAVVRRTIERFTAGSGVQRIEILDAKGEVVATVARAVVVAPGTRIDVLLSAEGGAVMAGEPLAPVRAEGRDVPHLKALLAAVAHRGLDTHGPVLAELLLALEGVGKGRGPGAAPAMPRPAASPSAKPAPSLVLRSVGLAIGDALPHFDAFDAEGKHVRTTELEGAPAVVAFAEPEAVERLREPVERVARERGCRCGIVAAEADAPVPHLPYLYLVDANGRVVARDSFTGERSVRGLFEVLRSK